MKQYTMTTKQIRQLVPNVKPRQKHAVLAEYAQRFKPKVFIETGSLRGDTLKAMLPYFERLYTIDVNPTFTAKVAQRFAAWPKVKAINGDSGVLLPELLKTIHEPCLFWLDAHMAGTHHDHYVINAPIREELETVLTHECAADHVVLVDDFWYFANEEWREVLPSVPEIEAIVKAKFPDWVFEIELDIMRCHRSR